MPTIVKYSKEELKEIIDLTRSNLNEITGEQVPDDVGMDVQDDEMMQDNTLQPNNQNNEDAEIIDKYGLDEYDESSDDERRNIIGGFGNLVQHDSTANDPYLEATDSEDEEDEADDLNITEDDNLLLMGKVQEDVSSLEVHVYNKEDNYIHHDIYIPAFPMCIETISYNSKDQCKCNYAAIGDMTKFIGIYDIDVVNQLEPIIKLKGHKDSVLDLSWNVKFPNILASCSVDQTVHLWDLNVNNSIHKLTKFNNRVQSLEFNQEDEGKLVIGDCDGKITLVDCNALSIQTYTIANKEIEKVTWHPNSVHNFVASTDKGTMHLFDTRVKDGEIKNIEAHTGSITDLAFSKQLCLSACEDGSIKIWDLSSNDFNLIDTYRESNVGKCFDIILYFF